MQRHPMKIKLFLNNHALTGYFFLAYAITWGSILALLGTKGFQLSTISFQDVLLFFVMMLAGPSLSSLLITALLEGRVGISEMSRRIMRRPVGLPWLAVALLTVPVLMLLTLFILRTTLSPAFTPGFQVIG